MNGVVLFGDECVDGDTEILTENGFVKFKELKHDYTKVAQWDNNKISFVKPIRYIKNKYKGERI